jgi:hypothetical protein
MGGNFAMADTDHAGNPGPSLHASNSLQTFSFEPEDDPVVCSMVSAAVEHARRARGGNGGGDGHDNRAQDNGACKQPQTAHQPSLHELDPATLKKRKDADLQRRLDVKRKYAELSSVVERLSQKAEVHGTEREALSEKADSAAADARDAERRRKTALVASSSSGGRRAAGGSQSMSNLQNAHAVKPFDVAAFTSLKLTRELEILHKQGLTSLKQLMNHKWAFPFAMPVDYETLGLSTYRDVVAVPMDLGTVRRLAEGTCDASDKRNGFANYVTCAELNAHVSLTFANAKAYNLPPTDVHIMAVALEEFWAPRWQALLKRSEDVQESLAAERECAVMNSEEIKVRRELANEEMRCAGVAADLDAARRRLEDLKRGAARSTLGMSPEEVVALQKDMTNLPKGYRAVARDLVAETEGAHRVPVDGVNQWSEVLDDLAGFGAVAHRRLQRFAKVRKRNKIAMESGKCSTPEWGFDAGTGVDVEWRVGEGGKGNGDGDETPKETKGNVDDKDEGNTKPEPKTDDAMDVDGTHTVNGNETTDDTKDRSQREDDKDADAFAAAAAAAARVGSGTSVMTAGDDRGSLGVGGEDPLLALAMGGGDWQSNTAGVEINPELVRLVSGGPS